jgi:hypothetical protein
MRPISEHRKSGWSPSGVLLSAFRTGNASWIGCSVGNIPLPAVVECGKSA